MSREASPSRQAAADPASAAPPVPQIIQSNIPLPPKLDLKGNLTTNWKRFHRLWTNYEIASRLNTQPSELRTATLLTCIGPDALEIFDGLPFENEAAKTNIDRVLELLQAHCIGETNEIYERYLFNKRDQDAGESFDSYIACLRSLAKTCNFGELQDSMIRDRVVVGIRDNGIRKRLLTESKLTLSKCIDICRANETTARQLREMTLNPSEEVKALTTGNPRRNGAQGNKERNKGKRTPNNQSPQGTCKFCLKNHPFKKELCPAWQKKCNSCGGDNHFAGSPVCKGKYPNRGKQKQNKGKQAVYKVEEESDESDYAFVVESVGSLNTDNHHKKIFAAMNVENLTVKFQLDSGSTVNILPVDVYKKSFSDPQCTRLRKSVTSLVMFNKSVLKPLGSIKAETRNPRNNQVALVEFIIVPEGHMPLLGIQAIQNFDLMRVNDDNIQSVNDLSPKPQESILD